MIDRALAQDAALAKTVKKSKEDAKELGGTVHVIKDAVMLSIMESVMKDREIAEKARENCLACRLKMYCPKHSHMKADALMPEAWKGDKLKAVMKFYGHDDHDHDYERDETEAQKK